jgi:hypothetical protein
MDDQTMTDPGVQWLLESQEPAIRRLARRDLLDEDTHEPVMDGPKVRALLQGLDDTTRHPYRKWDGAHWRLVELTELEATDDERVEPAANRVLDWATTLRPRRMEGLPRVHASQQGNALLIGLRVMRNDPRLHQLAHDLIAWQWPDGGWNCDPHATGRRSSFHESLIPMHALHEYGAHDAADRTAELLLDHRLFRSTTTGEPIHPGWLRLRHPPDWHYDILHALTVLARMHKADDPRAHDALSILRRRRQRNGRWRGSEMVTLNALRVLRSQP